MAQRAVTEFLEITEGAEKTVQAVVDRVEGGSWRICIVSINKHARMHARTHAHTRARALSLSLSHASMVCART